MSNWHRGAGNQTDGYAETDGQRGGFKVGFCSLTQFFSDFLENRAEI